jgi:hypothetical protein
MRFIFLTLLAFATLTVSAVEHPVLLSPKNQVDVLAAGGSDWIALRNQCDAELDELITPGYAGWDWRLAVERFSLAYRVAKQRGDTVRTSQYGRKALALLKVLARQHNYGTPENAVLIGLGDGSTKTFTLPFAPVDPSQVTVLTTPIATVPLVYAGATIELPDWGQILAIADTAGGAAAYPSSDWRFSYRDGGDVLTLRWLGAHHPASGATYYVRITTAGNDGAASAGSATVSGTTLTLTTAPASGRAVFARYLGSDYEQTGNALGGCNSVQPDGPGYPMRTFAVGLAYGYDLLHDLPEFTAELKQEFYTVLNAELDWYRDNGYERDGDIGNYFIRGYLTSALSVGWGTSDENPRAAEWRDLGSALLQRTRDGIAAKLPGGYGPQGTYAIGTTSDCLQLFTLWRDLTGEDVLPTLSWTDHLIPANIHGTRPDRSTFYDGGDWSDVMPPAVPYEIGESFLQYLPDHADAPYARQWLADVGHPTTSGMVTDYKTVYPLSYCAPTTGPLYTRSDWGTSAVWLAFAAGPIVVDHQHRDQGHVEIVRGGDPLLVDAGGYDASETTWHNSLLVDDRGSGDLVIYAPNQGSWGDDVAITRTRDAAGVTYAQADLTTAWASPYGGNAVQRAVRSLVFVRPDVVVVHDAVRVAQAATIVQANWNFAANPVQTGDVFKVTSGGSALFMHPLLPATISPAMSTQTYDGRVSYTYRQASPTGTSRAFLHVFEVAPSGQAAMRSSALVTSFGGAAQGVEVTAGAANRVLLFSAAGVEISERPLRYPYAVGGAQQHLIADLHPGASYQIQVSVGGSTVSTTTATASEAGTVEMTFTAAAGEVAISDLSTSDTTPPTITTAAHGPATVSTTSAGVAVAADDDAGQAGLTCSWTASRVGGGAAGVTFTPNASHASLSATANFTHAGTYTCTATVSDAAGNHVASTTGNIVVQQTATTVAIIDTVPTLAGGASFQFHAAVRDQFDDPLSAPSVTWSVDPLGAGGSISPGGFFTAPTVSAASTSTVRAASGAAAVAVVVQITGGTGGSTTSGSTTSGSTTGGGTGQPESGSSGGCGNGGSLAMLVLAIAGMFLRYRRR